MQMFTFLWRFAKVFSAKIYFQVKDLKNLFSSKRHHASGRDACKFAKVFSAKIFFQAITYCASGHGALG